MMDMPSPSNLNSAVDSFTKGNIESSTSSLLGSSLSSLSPNQADMFAGVMNGKISSADVEQICTVLAGMLMEIVIPGNPLALLAGPVVGKTVGSQVSQTIPTDVSLFSQPMNMPAVKGKQYFNVHSSMSNDMNAIKNSIGLDKVPDNINSTLSDLNFDKNIDNLAVDKQIKVMVDMAENPMAVFSQIVPAIATLVGGTVPGMQIKSTASANATVTTNATKSQLLDEVGKGKQKNLTMAGSISSINSSNNDALHKSISEAIQPFRGYCDDKIDSLPANDPQSSYYADMKNQVANMDVGKVAGDTSKDMDKKQITSLLKEKSNYDNAFYSLRNAWAERQHNQALDNGRTLFENDLASTYGITVNPATGLNRTLTTDLKFMAKVVKIYNKAKSTNDSVVNTASQSVTVNLTKQLPDMKPDDIAVLSKTIARQMPSQIDTLQKTGIDNLQFTGDRIITQLNMLKTSLSVNGLVKEPVTIVPMTGIAIDSV